MSVKDLFILPHPKSHAYALKIKYMRGKPRSSCKHHEPRTHVEDQVYAWKAHSSHVPESRLAQPKRDQDFSKPKSAMHMRRIPRICVGSQQLTFEAHVGRAK
ncbi:hypothetical protein PIB30_076472, partial [Stylosanthes scabra]|nr:hypothetical protein [Stylosanthes scabra]